MTLSSGARDRFVVFEVEGDACIGVLSEPSSARPTTTGVVIVVGGPQYRVGSHRQFVLLARALAAHGIPTLRFDYRGMGDSEGAARTFESVDADIAAAISTMQREARVSKIVLWGLCDGASAALMYAPGDDRVAGVVALNPWARSPQVEGSTRLRHYYARRLCSWSFWRKLLRGKFEVRDGAVGFLGSVRSVVTPAAAQPDFLHRMERAWSCFSRPMLFIVSGQDLTAREFEAWVAGAPQRRTLLQRLGTEVCAFADADHTFSTREWRDAVTARTVAWIAQLG